MRFIAKNHSNRGMAAIEMMIILPFMMLLIMGSIEFGLYFIKSQMAQRAVSMAVNAVQKDPYNVSRSSITVQNNILARLDVAPNYLCARAFQGQSEALNNSCNIRQWNTVLKNPKDNVYYVKIVAYIEQKPLLPMTKNFLGKDIIASAVAVVNLNVIPPECERAGYALQYDGKQYTCTQIKTGIPDCSTGGWALSYDKSTDKFSCVPTWEWGTMWWYTRKGEPICQGCDACTYSSLGNWARCPDNWGQIGYATCGEIAPGAAQKVAVLCRAPSPDNY